MKPSSHSLKIFDNKKKRILKWKTTKDKRNYVRIIAILISYFSDL